MIHDYDTHFWIAKTPDGWISAEDHASHEPIFQQAKRIRIEPLSAATVRAILEADVPDGYTAFLRTDIHQDIATNQIARLGYIMALERGRWEEPGKIALSDLPLVDGFRAELCCWNGQVDFESSANFSYKVVREDDMDLYKFMKV
jgi:hypothetical protein